MSREIWILTATAASLGFIHTIVGPDHYLPFVVMAKARSWPLRKTLVISFFSGLGHVLSSAVLGCLGVGLGFAVTKLESAESLRGSVAAWLLIGFGFAYFIWGLRKALRGKSHAHIHAHSPGDLHAHTHNHFGDHVHIHDSEKKANITPWILFTIFVFGPCEPLIPLVMYPAARHSGHGVVLVTTAFGLTTILTMLLIIVLMSWGVNFVRLGRFERYSHALAGAVICISGLAVQFLGL